VSTLPGIVKTTTNYMQEDEGCISSLSHLNGYTHIPSHAKGYRGNDE
jgi:hypothetical protein